MTASRSDIRQSRLVFGYLPLILVAAAIIVMVFVAPSDRDTDTSASSTGPVMPAGSATTQPVVATPADSTHGSETGGDAPADPNVGTTASGWGDSVTPCTDRVAQVFSGYSPPCFDFTGDNGGATSRGVTADEITVSYRYLADGHLIGTLGALGGNAIDEDADDLWRTAEGLVDYFNNTYQFYGRRIVLDRFDGTGQFTAELTGGGQESAANDALTAVDHNAFADVNNGLVSTQPYAEALTANGVISLGVGYMSRQWFTDRGPYAWSAQPDCTLVSEVSAEVAVNILLSEPAVLAGGDMRDRPRRMGVVHPNNPEYTRCVDESLAAIEAGGFEVALRQNYTLDLAQTSSNASAILARLKDAGITSVACACDPLMMQALAGQAESQEYYPEWFIVGVGFIDLDLVGQMIAANSGSQWTRAIGGSNAAVQQPFGTSEAYRAYRSVRDDQPSIAIDAVYAQLLRLAIGIQMAGPDLTPETFAQGMYNYPEGDGTFGALDFSPDNHAGIIDARLVFWDPDLPSPFNGKPGTYVDTGERFRDVSEAPSQDELLAVAQGAGLMPDAGSPGGEDESATTASDTTGGSG